MFSREEDDLTNLMATFEEVQLLCPLTDEETDPEGLNPRSPTWNSQRCSSVLGLAQQE